MDISIVIVSWNVADRLENNLTALFESRGLTYEVFVVDNASGDRTVEMIKNNFPNVELIVNKENLGFAKACNQAIVKSKGRYILLLNPDMLVKPDTLVRTVDWLDKNNQAAIAGIKLINENDEIIPQVRRFPKLFDQFLVASKIAHAFPFLLNHYLYKNFDYEKDAQVDSIRGSFFVIRRSAYEKLGLLDTRYFIWFEEVDYCRLAKASNLEVWYTPIAISVDYIGQSFKKVSLSKAQNYFKDSMLAYFKKWQPAWQLLILKLAWWFGGIIVKFFS